MLTELKELRAKNEGKYNWRTYKMTNWDTYHCILNHANFYAWSTANLQMLHSGCVHCLISHLFHHHHAPAQQHRLDEVQRMKEAQQENITSLKAELQSTNEALNDVSLAKETAVKEKVIVIVHHSYIWMFHPQWCCLQTMNVYNLLQSWCYTDSLFRNNLKV